MELKHIYKWTRDYTLGVNLNKIEWIVLNPEELQKFYYDNYLDFVEEILIYGIMLLMI